MNKKYSINLERSIEEISARNIADMPPVVPKKIIMLTEKNLAFFLKLSSFLKGMNCPIPALPIPRPKNAYIKRKLLSRGSFILTFLSVSSHGKNFRAVNNTQANII